MTSSSRRAPRSSVSKRRFIGYMAFCHATGAMALMSGYSPWLRGMKVQISNATGKEATLFADAESARRWVDRTIKSGRREWQRRFVSGEVSGDWHTSNWKWLFRQTWSVVPCFMALPGEHLRRTS